MLEAIVTIVFIIGLLNFAQEAPDLIKNLFKGSMFDGLDLNPRGQFKKNAKPLAKAIGTGAGALGGLAAGGIKAFKNAGKDYDKVGGTNKKFRKLHTLGSTLGGALRGAGAGGLAGFKKSNELGFKDAFDSLMSGTTSGKNSAQRASQNYREGDSTNMFKRMATRVKNRAGDFASDHIVDPAQEFWETAYGNRTSEAAQEVYNTVKDNNKAATTAIGKDSDLTKLEDAYNKAKEEISKSFLEGKIDASTYKTKMDAAKANYETQKDSIIASGFEKLSETRREIIEQRNKESIDNFSDNVALLGEDDLKSVISSMTKALDLSSVISVDADGKYTGTDSTKDIETIIQTLNSMNKAENMSNNNGKAGQELMSAMDALKKSMDSVNKDIDAVRENKEHKKSKRNTNNGGNNSNSNDGGNK